MTDFKITPEDVGRVAVDVSGTCWRVLDYDPSRIYQVTARSQGNEVAALFMGSGVRSGGREPLTHWKPETLKAPKRWWIVWRGLHDELFAVSHRRLSIAESEKEGRSSRPIIARIYDHHWHGHEEGTFHTPEDVSDEKDTEARDE